MPYWLGQLLRNCELVLHARITESGMNHLRRAGGGGEG